ncbi:conserved hypothetical protein [Prosthecochloris aestuarii DSM 271]|uniref:Uncharacterized protein n=1 Tax=Prosthecochloris aestuarii (strain DSM 271 / SK 413) TaxID=290512 RepID=B4S6C1_PROA2|nr:hypothetical protein [Prosthecochloris aestuarii]ACF47223.1 conserved hypothetical protein [Prosthecochloris aestuarii DSM 271]
MSEQEIVFDDFIDAASNSFGAAQKGIGLPEGMQSAMMISEAELTIKTSMRMNKGRLALEPVSSASSVKGGVQPDALSTVTIRYVAARSEGAVSNTPQKTRDEVLREVSSRKDLTRLQDILGTLDMNADYVKELDLWTVKVTDDRSRVVRVLNIEDKKK